MRNIDEIVVHCSATKPAWMQGKSLAAKVAEIKRWHTDPKPRGRGWSDIGYHYLIDRDGTVMVGRPVERTGAHTRGHNRKTIGVCLIGGHGSSADDDFSENFTASQDKRLNAFIAELKRRHPTIAKVSGHNQYAAKACPGFNVMIWSRRHKEKRRMTFFEILKSLFR